jgi:hypothetical protein
MTEAAPAGAEQHDAGVVDQGTGGAGLLADAVGGDDDAVAVSDVRFDGGGPVAQFADAPVTTATLSGVLLPVIMIRPSGSLGRSCPG